MNKKILFLIPVLMILLVSMVSADLTTDLEAYYKYDTDADDIVGTNDITISGATLTTGNGGLITEAYSHTTSKYYLDFTPTLEEDFSITAWIKPSVLNGYSIFMQDEYSSGSIIGVKFTSTGSFYFCRDDSGTWGLVGNTSDYLSTSDWNMIIIEYDASLDTAKLYVNNVLVKTIVNLETRAIPLTVTGRPHDTTNNYNGLIDEISRYSRLLISDEKTSLYNSGTGLQYPFTATSSNFQVTNTNSIKNMTAYLNSTSYSTTNGTIMTEISSDQELDLTVKSDEGYYFNTARDDYNLSNDLQVTFIEYPRITLYDEFTGGSINSFSVYSTLYNSSSLRFNTTDGVAFVGYNSTRTVLLKSKGYFDKRVAYNFTNSNDLNTSMYQAIINISINESYSGNPVNGWTLKNGSTILINTSLNNGLLYGIAGSYNDLTLISNSGAFSDRSLVGFNVSSLDNKTVSYELLPTEFTVTAKNILTDAVINNFSVSYSSLNNSHSGSFSTTDGDIIFGVINGDTYNITIDASGYALFGNSILSVVSGNTAYEFSLYTNNSISFEARWEENNTLISDNISLVLTGGLATYSYSFIDCDLYVDNLIDDTYSIRASLDGFDDKYYSVTVGGRSHQDLTVYFAEGYDNVTFLFQDKNTGTSLSGVYVSMSRYINGSLVVVSSKLSDITGTVKAKYVPDTFYQVSGLKSGYAVKTFELDPIESDLYIVKMESAASNIFISDGVGIYYSPGSFVSGNNSFSISFISPLGTLSDYWVNVSYPGGSIVRYGSESIGEVFDFSLLILNPSLYDSVRVEYNYTTSLFGNKGFVFSHPIDFSNASSTAFTSMKYSYSDMGIFERVMLVMVVVILLAGFGFLLGGVGGSLTMGILAYVFFAATGFIPLWIIIITVIAGALLIFRGGIFG